MELLAAILTEGTGMLALRDALTGLGNVRHAALSAPAYKAWELASSLTMCEMYDAAEAWGIEGHEVHQAA